MGSALRLVNRRISVAIVRDDTVTREGVAALLSKDGEFAVVASGSDIRPVSGDVQPDIYLVEAHMLEAPDGQPSPAAALAEGGARVIATGLSPDRKGLASLVRAGVFGFVVKDASFSDLADTIRSVASGVQVMPPSLISALFKNVAEEGDERTDTTRAALERMTPREREITLLIAEAKSNKEIAVATNISTHTVKCHVRNIMEKLSLHTRLQIAARANAEDWSVRFRLDKQGGARPMLRAMPMDMHTSPHH